MMHSPDLDTLFFLCSRGVCSDDGESSGVAPAETALALSMFLRDENHPPDALATAGPYGGQNW